MIFYNITAFPICVDCITKVETVSGQLSLILFEQLYSHASRCLHISFLTFLLSRI